MKTIVLDGKEMLTRHQLHEYIARRLCFPEHYGNNLDALHDCLGEIAEPTLLVLYNADAMTEALGHYGTLLLKVLSLSSKENPNIRFEIDCTAVICDYMPSDGE